MSTVTSKGQVTIPKPIRDTLGIGPGSEVEFRLNDAGEVVLVAPLTPKPESRFARFRGVLKSDLTTDEIMAILRGDD